MIPFMSSIDAPRTNARRIQIPRRIIETNSKIHIHSSVNTKLIILNILFNKYFILFYFCNYLTINDYEVIPYSTYCN